MIGNPYPQHQNVQEWNDFVNEVRNVLARTEKAMENLKERVLAGEGEYDFPDATEEEKGMMKLYQTIGDNDDGAISQIGIKIILQDYALKTMLNSYYTKEEINTKLTELFASDTEINGILNRILPSI